MPETTRDPLERCAVHEMQNCAICWPPTPQYRRGTRTIDVPPGSFVEVRGGKGVYHHPDCYNVTGEWEGADQATLGELIIHRPGDPQLARLRPAQFCEPPSIRE